MLSISRDPIKTITQCDWLLSFISQFCVRILIWFREKMRPLYWSYKLIFLNSIIKPSMQSVSKRLNSMYSIGMLSISRDPIKTITQCDWLLSFISQFCVRILIWFDFEKKVRPLYWSYKLIFLNSIIKSSTRINNHTFQSVS
jgi:hypothetical protein